VIAFIIGTTAELIKVAPVYHELRSRGHAAELWYTAQHVDELEPTLADLQLPPIARWLVPERSAVNLARPAQVPGWASRVVRTVLRGRAELRKRLTSDGEPPVVLVHGDTFTAPIGALIGRALGARIGHLEAGMRSGSIRNPFPEELNRRAAAHLVDVHFAPTAVEAHNLRHRRGAIVTMGANTVVDALRLALDTPVESGVRLPARFGIATLHRFELVRQEETFRASLEALRDYARDQVPIIYFSGASERERIDAFHLWDLFDPERFRIEDKLSYVRFQPVLAKAEFVVTDSGGVQEEAYLLGIPCAVHRTHTERHVGEGEQMVLTRYELDELRTFLADHERYRRPSSLDRYRPSAVVVDALESMAGTPKGAR
jgi:UDP-N-acetylglucosamine 2-epimerase (non-hydrolysing)